MVYTQASTTSINGLTLNAAGTKIAVTFESAAQNLAIISALTGSVINYFFRSSFPYIYYPKGVIMDSSDNMFIGA
jgi:hypothetical protein